MSQSSAWPPPECKALQKDYSECFSKMAFTWGDTPEKERYNEIFENLQECITAAVEKRQQAKGKS